MPMGRPKIPLLLSPEESEQLRAVSASRSLPYGLVLRTKIILLSASGMSNQAIAARLKLHLVTVELNEHGRIRSARDRPQWAASAFLDGRNGAALFAENRLGREHE